MGFIERRLSLRDEQQPLRTSLGWPPQSPRRQASQPNPWGRAETKVVRWGVEDGTEIRNQGGIETVSRRSVEAYLFIYLFTTCLQQKGDLQGEKWYTRLVSCPYEAHEELIGLSDKILCLVKKSQIIYIKIYAIGKYIFTSKQEIIHNIYIQIHQSLCNKRTG